MGKTVKIIATENWMQEIYVTEDEYNELVELQSSLDIEDVINNYGNWDCISSCFYMEVKDEQHNTN